MDSVYDVFISKNTDDLNAATVVTDHLKKAGLSVFESEESLSNIGDSNYSNAIDQALERSRNLLVICSENENGEKSQWVKHEWSSFRTEIFNNRKKGNIIVILLEGIQLGSIAYGLRSYQSFWFENLDYSKLIRFFRPDLCPDASGEGSKLPDDLHREEQDASGGSIVKQSIVIDNIVFDMIRVEGGDFSMNGKNRKIHSFYLGQMPVTEELWDKVMGENPRGKLLFKNSSLATSIAKAGAIMVAPPLAFPALVGTAVSNLVSDFSLQTSFKPYWKASHADAVEFVGRISQMTGIEFSLPTEEEWEYAARGGRFAQGFIYAGSNDIDCVGWFLLNSKASVRHVGKKQPNELGLYDMSGNVLEWTDTFCPETKQYVRRGGNCYSRAEHCQVFSRVTGRLPLEATFPATGLRLVARDLNVSLA